MLHTAESIQIIAPIVSILFLILSFKRNIYGVISYFIISTVKLGEMYPSFGAIRFEVVAAIVVYISIAVSGKGLSAVSPKRNIINKSLWILFFVGMLSVPQAVDISISWKNGGYELIKLVLFYIMIVCSIHEKGDLTKLLWAFMLITAWVAYEPVSNYFLGNVVVEEYGVVALGRFGAASGHVALANTLNQGIPIMYFLALKGTKRYEGVLIWALIGLCVTGVIVSRSRGGFLGLLVLALGIIYFAEKRRKAVILLGIVFLFSIPVLGQQYYDHVASIADGVGGSRSSEDRYLGLVNGIEMMIKRPLLGVGIACYEEARSQYFHYRFYSHNLYGELFGELGLGSAAWFFWIYVIFKRTIALKAILNLQPERNLLYFSVLSGIQLALFLRLFMGNFTHGSFFWFWFLAAALTASVDKLVGQMELQETESKG